MGGEESLEKGLGFEFPVWDEIGFTSGCMSFFLVDTSGALAGSSQAGTKPSGTATSRSPCEFFTLSFDPSNAKGCLDSS